MDKQKGISVSGEQDVDEMLELIWTLEEGGQATTDGVSRALGERGVEGILDRMVEGGLIAIDEGRLSFEPKGAKRAEGITRRHRLAERLLTDLFELREEEVESQACQFEHILSTEVTDSVCTLLGHPPSCPHGKAIPRGRCCLKARTKIKPIVVRLSDLGVGETGRIVSIAPKHHARLDHLIAFGIAPGTSVRLHQKRPSYVIEIDETTLAIETDICREIFVTKAAPNTMAKK